ncbi:hypothetical protein ES703_38317 [subsurface metagenome]
MGDNGIPNFIVFIASAAVLGMFIIVAVIIGALLLSTP